MNSWHPVVLLAAPPPPDPGGQGEDFGKSSPVGLVLLIVFAIAVAFLVRSMTKHLKKLPVAFDEAKAEAAAPARSKRLARKSSNVDAAESDADPAEGEKSAPGSPEADDSPSERASDDGEDGGDENVQGEENSDEAAKRR